LGFVLDTNVFNRVLDRKFDVSDLPPGADLIASHIQVDELNATSDPKRREELLLVFKAHARTVVPTESFVLSVSRLGEARLGSGEEYSAIRAELDKRNRGRPNNVHDALIAEIAIASGHTLVTADRALSEVAKERGCNVLFLAS
jgi:predicted nucleic acid-binding protein